LGMAASGASLLLSAAAPGRRLALPNSLVVIHQPWAQGMQGQATDLDVHAREILRQRALLIELYHRHTGRDSEQIGRDIERDYHMTAEQALAYGMIDHIIEKRPAASIVSRGDPRGAMVTADVPETSGGKPPGRRMPRNRARERRFTVSSFCSSGLTSIRVRDDC